MLNYYKIKEWCPERNKWVPNYYYIVKPILPRTIGYIVQSNIDKLPTKKDILHKIFRCKL